LGRFAVDVVAVVDHLKCLRWQNDLLFHVTLCTIYLQAFELDVQLALQNGSEEMSVEISGGRVNASHNNKYD